MRLSLGLGLCALALPGCPRKPPPDPATPPVSAAEVATLSHTFDALDLGMYAALTAGPAEGLPVGELARSHDADRYTATLEDWGPPSVAVLQLEDTDARTRIDGAVAGWKLTGDGPADSVPVAPEDLRHGALAERTVGSVLVRAWDGGVVAPDPFDLLLDVAAQLPAPWSVCRPRTPDHAAAEEADGADPEAAAVVDPIQLFAVDPDRGARLGLRAVGDAVSGSGPFSWTIDHLEFAPAIRPAERLWTDLGYADCVEIGRVIDADKARRPKHPLGPRD